MEEEEGEADFVFFDEVEVAFFEELVEVGNEAACGFAGEVEFVGGGLAMRAFWHKGGECFVGVDFIAVGALYFYGKEIKFHGVSSRSCCSYTTIGVFCQSSLH